MAETKQDTSKANKWPPGAREAYIKAFRERQKQAQLEGGRGTLSLSSRSREDTVKVSDKTKQSLMPDWIPDRKWIRRAADKNTPVTSKRETMQTASTWDDSVGKEILFPMVRLVDGKLKRFKTVLEAKEESIKKKDFIPFDTDKEATAFSRKLSKYVGEARGMD